MGILGHNGAYWVLGVNGVALIMENNWTGAGARRGRWAQGRRRRAERRANKNT